MNVEKNDQLLGRREYELEEDELVLAGESISADLNSRSTWLNPLRNSENCLPNPRATFTSLASLSVGAASVPASATISQRGSWRNAGMRTVLP